LLKDTFNNEILPILGRNNFKLPDNSGLSNSAHHAMAKQLLINFETSIKTTVFKRLLKWIRKSLWRILRNNNPPNKIIHTIANNIYIIFTEKDLGKIETTKKNLKTLLTSINLENFVLQPILEALSTNWSPGYKCFQDEVCKRKEKTGGIFFPGCLLLTQS